MTTPVRLGALLVVLAAPLLLGASPRPYLGDGNCLSCHGETLPALPSSGCVSCHSGNLDFLCVHGSRGSSELAVAGSLTGAGVLALIAAGLILRKRGALLLGLLSAAALAASPTPPDFVHSNPALPGGFVAARGFACDLQAIFSPSGNAFLFAKRGPDTSGDGAVGLQDGQALFLWRRGWERPRRLTPYALDFQPKMARWSPSGERFVVPCPTGLSALSGLLLFDASGCRLSSLESRGFDMLCPSFSPDGQSVAFAEGRGIGVWETAALDRKEALAPLPEGQFPRLWGWDSSGKFPLFSRGYDYLMLGRSASGGRDFPPEIPLEIASGGEPRLLTPPGPIPLRRYAAQRAQGGLFYLARNDSAPTGLYFFDGSSERLWSPPGMKVLGSFQSTPSGLWAFLVPADGSAGLALLAGPGRPRWRGPRFASRQAALAADGARAAACMPESRSRGFLEAAADSHGVPFSGAPGAACFAPAVVGEALSAACVEHDTDGDGRLTPLDQGELWVTWRKP